MNTQAKTVIEITSTHIKVLQLFAGKAKPSNYTCAIKEIDPKGDSAIINSLWEVLDSSEKQEEYILILPRRIMVLKQMRLPSLDKEEIRKMIGLQLIEKTPYSLDDMVFDFDIIEQDSSGYSKVLVSAINKEVCQKYDRMFAKAGFNLRTLTVSSYGVMRWFDHHYGQKNPSSAQDSVLLINVDNTYTELCFCARKKLLFSRSFNYGFKEREDRNYPELINQVRVSIKSYREEQLGPELKGVYLIAASDAFGRLKNLLAGNLNLPVFACPLGEAASFQGPVEATLGNGQKDVSWAAALGILFMNESEMISLTPHEVHEKWQRKQQKNQWMAIAMSLAGILAVSVSAFSFFLWQKTIQLNRIEHKMSRLKPLIKEAKEKKEFLDLLDREFKQRVFVPELMRELHRLAPREVFFLVLNLDERGRFEIQGYADNSASVNDFQSSLVKSLLFKKVSLRFAKKKRLKNMDLTEFKISSELWER